jgi:hypothetical protein
MSVVAVSLHVALSWLHSPPIYRIVCLHHIMHVAMCAFLQGRQVLLIVLDYCCMLLAIQYDHYLAWSEP